MLLAEGEQEASVMLREAGETLGQHSGALQLRYLQVRHNIQNTVSKILKCFIGCQKSPMSIIENNLIHIFSTDHQQHWKREKLNNNISPSDGGPGVLLPTVSQVKDSVAITRNIRNTE